MQLRSNEANKFSNDNILFVEFFGGKQYKFKKQIGKNITHLSLSIHIDAF